PVISRALSEARCTWNDIDAISVTYAPGLVGSLLVGTLAARTLAIVHGKPLYPVHHVEGHVYANFITDKSDTIQLELPESQPNFPLLALIVSGGHSQLVLFRDHGDYELLGQTQDDAVGEAFDKVAKILGLPYPGGPSVSEAAKAGDGKKYKLPKARLENKYDFSFSGLKTAVLRSVQKNVGKDYTFPSHELSGLLTPEQCNDFAASFQHTAVETLVDKTEAAFNDYSPASVVIAGGVAANQELRRELSARIPVAIEYAPPSLCTDNAAMIASLGYFFSQKQPPADPYALEVVPSISMDKTAWSQS
ncbi:tRNA (adenosine(37)-N6)-threonylcarbamoyltransferase complex transferase subunit TsaD, partial [Candidatus Nomurabacteria bacterium]|nr:tRNA (adenosine(37)-N6)-threonylcarbamoyltransferase complex transferase subunit TsaD [Candidatus Nomurabacteria bacterium]